MRAALACLLVGSLVACGGGGGGGGAQPKKPVGPAIDAKQAEQDASDLITEIYGTLGRGSKDSLFTLLDDSLIVFGPRSSDMLGTRADALVALGQVVDPKEKKTLAIRSGQLEVVAAPGGRSAWAVDAATINGQPHTIVAVLTNTDDLWLVEAVSVARAPAAPQLKAELAKDAVVPPGAAGTRKQDPRAKGAIEKLQRGLLDQAALGAELASRDQAAAIGPTAGEVTRGKKAQKSLWKKRVEAKTRAAIAGEITAAVTDDGQLAWVSAPITRVEGDGAQPLPLRAFAIFEKAGGDWRLVALHESAALGEPGAGAGFKKILPPRPAEPKPPEVIADKPKAKDKAKDKTKDKDKDKDEARKSKKKAKPDDDEPKKKLAKARSDDDGDDEPKRKKKRTFSGKDDDEDEQPKKKAKPDDEDDQPKKKAKAEDDEPKKKAKAEDDEPKKKAKAEDDEPKKKVKAEDDEPKKKAEAKAEDDEPKPKKKKRSFFNDDEEEEQPKKKPKPKAAAQPKKKPRPKAEEEPKKPADDEDVIEIE